MSEHITPEEALIYVLPYLGVRELLCLEQVCRYLREAVRNDPLVWHNLRIEPPLNRSLSDDKLVNLASRAKGQLQHLCIANCLRISDQGLGLILPPNQSLVKVCVSGCTQLTIDAFVVMMRDLAIRQPADGHRICQVRIRGLYGVTKQHVEDLYSILAPDGLTQTVRRLQFYHDNHYSHCDDPRCIDVEPCPKCDVIRMLYDCPRTTCQCRGCYICIPRCSECGICPQSADAEFEPTLSSELVCSTCWSRLPKCSHCYLAISRQHSTEMGFQIADHSASICYKCREN